MDDFVTMMNKISEFNDIHEFMGDPEVDEALIMIVKIISKPDVPPAQAVVLIPKLQAMSAKFGLLASWYTTAAKGSPGSINHTKKNIYYTMRESLDKIVDSLKYVVRAAL